MWKVIAPRPGRSADEAQARPASGISRDNASYPWGCGVGGPSVNMAAAVTGSSNEFHVNSSEQTSEPLLASMQQQQQQQPPAKHAAASPAPMATPTSSAFLTCDEDLGAEDDDLDCTSTLQESPASHLQKTPHAGPHSSDMPTQTASLLCNSMLQLDAACTPGDSHSPGAVTSRAVAAIMPSLTLTPGSQVAPPHACQQAVAAESPATVTLPRVPSSSSSCNPASNLVESSSSSSSDDDDDDDMCPPVACASPHRRGPKHAIPPAQQQQGDAAVGLLYDESMELHRGPQYPEHYELPERIIQVYAELESQGLMSRCWQLPPRPATHAELLAVHTQEHLDEVQGLWKHRPADQADAKFINKGADLYLCHHTASAARMAAGCCVQAVHSVLQGEVQAALAVVRPPGHHAECARASGFCFYNNCAVAARAALQHPGVQRVLVLDWDVHHGNGIQEVLWEDPHILYISIHRDPKNFYPFIAGFIEEVGDGAGKGMNINIPWAKRNMGDAEYLAAFSLVVEPVLQSWQPDLVIVAAGFDAAEGDPLGGCKLSPEGYAAMTRRLLQFAKGRLVLALEGGYNTRVTAACAAACVRVLLEEHPTPHPVPVAETPAAGSTSTASSKQGEQARGQPVPAPAPAPVSAPQAAADTLLHAAHVVEPSVQAAQAVKDAAAAGAAAVVMQSGTAAAVAQQVNSLQLDEQLAFELAAGVRLNEPEQDSSRQEVLQEQGISANVHQHHHSHTHQQQEHQHSTQQHHQLQAGGQPQHQEELLVLDCAAAQQAARAAQAKASPSSQRSSVAAELASRRQAMPMQAAASPSGDSSSSSCVMGSTTGTVWPSGDAIKLLRQVCEVQAPYWPVLVNPPFNKRWEEYQQGLQRRQSTRKK